MRGVAYRYLDQHEKAIADLTEAIRLDPQFAFAYGSRSIAYEKAGQQYEADADNKRACELDRMWCK